jgi:hypothetical protein
LETAAKVQRTSATMVKVIICCYAFFATRIAREVFKMGGTSIRSVRLNWRPA